MRLVLILAGTLLLLNAKLAVALNLKEAIASAEQIDPIVQSALANSNASLAGVQIARSKILPTIQGVGSYGRTNQTTNQIDPVLGLYSQKYINSTPSSQVYLRQALFRMADWAGLSVSDLQNEYGLFRLASAYSDLWLRVSNAWFDLVAAQETLDIQLASEKAMELIAEQAQKSFEAGVGTKDSAVEAKAQLAFTKSNRLEAQLMLAARQRNLVALTNLDLNRVTQTHLRFAQKYQALTSTANLFLVKANSISPEILSAKMAEEIRRMQLKQARFNNYPTVDFFASYQQTQNYNINQIGLGVISSQAAVQLNIPFYTGGLYQGQERQAAAYLESAIADVRAAELRLNTSVSQFWATQEAQLERFKAAQEMVRAGQEVVTAYRMGVRAGTKSWSDVANAQVVLTRRQVDQAGIISNLLKAQAQLLAFLPVTDESWQYWLNTVTFDVAQVGRTDKQVPKKGLN
jgi:outer membrane protein TolC